MRLRVEQAADRPAIHDIHRSAFETPAEARLVDELRTAGAVCLSLVAERDGLPAGHVLYSPVTIADQECGAIGLAPVAVRPEFQKQGIGTALIRESLRLCRQSGYQSVCVLGHPEFYRRFGFRSAGEFGLSCEYDVPPEVFMVLELQPDSLRHRSGVIRYHPLFRDL